MSGCNIGVFRSAVLARDALSTVIAAHLASGDCTTVEIDTPPGMSVTDSAAGCSLVRVSYSSGQAEAVESATHSSWCLTLQNAGDRTGITRTTLGTTASGTFCSSSAGIFLLVPMDGRRRRGYTVRTSNYVPMDGQ
jgi:hypothetical protein